MFSISKVRRIFFISIIVLLTGLIGTQVCAGKEQLIILANDQDYQNAQRLISDMKKYEVSYTRIDASKFEQFKGEQYIFILGGPKSGDGMDAIFKKVLSPEEYAFLEDSGNMDMYLKQDVWGKEQSVIVIGVSDSAQIEGILFDFRPAWMGNLVDWFDLDINWEEYVY